MVKWFLESPETTLKTLWEHSPEAILILDRSGNILHANPAAHRMLGYPEDELAGKNISAYLIGWEGKKRSPDSFLKAGLANAHLYGAELKRRDGKIIYSDINLSETIIEKKRHTVVFAHDVTEQRRLTLESEKDKMLLSDILNAIEDGISLLDKDLNIILTNAWMEKMYPEHTPLAGKKCYQVYQQRTSPCPFCPSLPTLKTGKPHEAVVPYPSEKAPARWMALFTYPVRDMGGNVTGIVEYVRDITEQKLLEDKLTESEEKYRGFFESLDVFAYSTSKEGKFLSINEAGIRFLGYTKEDLLNLRVSDTYENPEDRKRLIEEIERRGSLYDYPVRLRRKDGTIRSCRIMAVCTRDKQGKVTGYQGIIRDVTEKEEAKKELIRLNTLARQSDLEIIITDINGNIEYVNPAFEKITGYSAAEAVGKNPRILKSGKQDEAFYKNLWGTITAGQSWKGRFVNKRKDGSLYNEEAHIFPVQDKKGNILNFAAIKRDITQEVILEEDFQQAAKLEAIGQLVGGIAHDFNNVLTSIQGFAELGLSKISHRQPLWEELTEIHSAAKQAARITQQLLGFSRKQMISPKIVDVSVIIEEMAPMLRRYIGEDIDLYIVPAKERAVILADRGQIEQCILNLVVNARDAIRDKKEKQGQKTITIETSRVVIDDGYLKNHVGITKGPYLVIAVSDTGIGMDRETLNRVFDPFFTTKPKGKGTGLGCSTVFGIVKQNRGNVRAYSELGIGTTIKIYWPVAEEGAVAEKAEEVISPTTIKGNETILVVEDDRGIREFVMQALKSFGYEVYTAEEGEQALSLIKEKNLSPDLLFTDVIMPKMGGRELSEALSSQFPNLKTIYTSGYSENHIFQNGVLEPETYFLHKPYTVRDLLKKVRSVLDS